MVTLFQQGKTLGVEIVQIYSPLYCCSCYTDNSTEGIGVLQ